MKHEQLAGPLGRRVGRDRLVDGVVLGERHLLVDPVDGGGGGEDEVRRAVPSRRLEQAQGPDAVDLFVEDRLGEARPHAGPGGEVDHGVEAARGEQAVDQRGVADVALDQPPVVALRELGGVGALQGGVVEVVEIVEDGDPVAPVQESAGDVSCR